LERGEDLGARRRRLLGEAEAGCLLEHGELDAERRLAAEADDAQLSRPGAGEEIVDRPDVGIVGDDERGRERAADRGDRLHRLEQPGAAAGALGQPAAHHIEHGEDDGVLGDGGRRAEHVIEHRAAGPSADRHDVDRRARLARDLVAHQRERKIRHRVGPVGLDEDDMPAAQRRDIGGEGLVQDCEEEERRQRDQRACKPHEFPGDDSHAGCLLT
jgi:hypothetical protein